MIQRFSGYSSSGGVIDDEGFIYCCGHDAAELYILKFPEGGSSLELVEVLDVTFPGQGIARDPFEPGTLYSISKASRQVVVGRITNL